MHLLYGTNPLPQVSCLTVTLSFDMADISHSELFPRSSNFPSTLLKSMLIGIGLHASIVGEDVLQVSVTSRVIPKSLRV
jgi:hypothetical protein